MQTTSHLLMIRPVNFSFNAETAVNNAFQVTGAADNAQSKALTEFDNFVHLLRDNGIDVTVIGDTPQPYTPDSIFPNNWISFHDAGTVCLYPMFAVNRRLERKQHILDAIGKKFRIDATLDFSSYEDQKRFLEGTGSMVLDREHRIAYACISPRTDIDVLRDFCQKMGYTPEIFTATDSNGLPVYHTNVMMCVADKYVVVCLDSVPDEKERNHLAGTILNSRKALLPITLEQMNHFAGNMLQVHNQKGGKLLVMSTQAYESLTPGQIEQLESFNRILYSPLTTIETNGGGSARCMLAEIHLEPLEQR